VVAHDRRGTLLRQGYGGQAEESCPKQHPYYSILLLFVK
jgi:hypothetical protein